jgi:hypothetical protein
MKSWKSPVYEHFVMPPNIIVQKNGVVSYVFMCRQCVYFIHRFLVFTNIFHRKPSISVSRRREDKSTSNLLSHAKSCDPDPTAQVNAIEGYAHGCSYSPEALRLLLVKWVTSCSRPFSIVQDEPFIQIVRMLYSQATLISPHTLSTDVKRVFNVSRESLIKCFEVCSYF